MTLQNLPVLEDGARISTPSFIFTPFLSPLGSGQVNDFQEFTCRGSREPLIFNDEV